MRPLLTFTEIRDNRLQNAFITLKSLNKMKVKELRLLAAQCGIKRGKMKKAELISSIHEDLEPERVELAAKEIKASQEELAEKINFLTDSSDGDMALDYAKRIKEITHQLWNGVERVPGDGEIQVLAIEFTTKLDKLYESASTKHTQLSKLCGKIQRLLEEEEGVWQEHYLYWHKLFKASAMANGRPWKKETNAKTREGLKVRKENKRPLNVDPLVLKVQNILASPDHYSWKDVACALIFATGRRPVEIMSLATFVSADNYSVVFYGRAKTKLTQGGKEHLKHIEIPTVVPGEQILNAMQFIEDKRFKPDSEDFNDRKDAADRFTNSGTRKAIARNMSKFMEGIDGKFSPKDLRVIYAQYMLALNNPNESVMDKDMYIAKIMGHTEGDFNTKHAYDADYRVAL